MTIASLGIAVQSGQSVTAAADLDKLTAAAGRAEQGAARLAKSYGDAGSVVARINQMMAGGSGGASSHIAAFGNELDRLRQKFNPLYAEQRRFASVSEEISRAQRLGALTATEATAALERERTALNSATAAMRQNTQAANDNRVAMINRGPSSGAQNFNTANVAAQFQDIAVTSAMGMNPLQIALQQGTQLSAVLGGQGLTGVVRTLGGAFASILSPVSILTIGVVALGAMGLQALGGIFKGAESATDAVERHNKTLDKTLLGYESVRDAADEAYEAALKLPEGSATAQLGSQQASAAERATAAMEKAIALRKEFEGYAGFAASGAFGIPADLTKSLVSVSETITRLTANSSLSRQELDELHVTLSQLGANTGDQNIKSIVNEALALVDSARQANAEVDSLDAALRNIPTDIKVRISVSQVFSDAMSDIGDLYMDPRSRFDQARAQLELRSQAAQDAAQTTSELTALASDYQRVLESINTAEAKANERSGKAAASAAAKPFNQWESATGAFQKRIDQQRMETELLGLTTYEIERQRAAFDLLNQAKDAGIPITAAVTEQINAMSSEYASATVELERQTKAQREFDESVQVYRGAFNGLFADLKSGLREGHSFWEALGNAGANALDKIADRALSMAANGIFDMIFGSLMGGFGSNSLGGGWGIAGGFGGSGIFGISGMAEGGTVARGGLSWVGERGPELLRLPTGAQVIPNGPSMAMAANQNSPRGPVNVHIHGAGLSQEQMTSAISDALDYYDRKTLPSRVNELKNNQLVVNG